MSPGTIDTITRLKPKQARQAVENDAYAAFARSDTTGMVRWGSSRRHAVTQSPRVPSWMPHLRDRQMLCDRIPDAVRPSTSLTDFIKRRARLSQASNPACYL
jgi:hypothetical protein